MGCSSKASEDEVADSETWEPEMSKLDAGTAEDVLTGKLGKRWNLEQVSEKSKASGKIHSSEGKIDASSKTGKVGLICCEDTEAKLGTSLWAEQSKPLRAEQSRNRKGVSNKPSDATDTYVVLECTRFIS